MLHSSTNTGMYIYALISSPGIFYETLMHPASRSGLPYNALHSPSNLIGANLSEPHTSMLNGGFSYVITRGMHCIVGRAWANVDITTSMIGVTNGGVNVGYCSRQWSCTCGLWLQRLLDSVWQIEHFLHALIVFLHALIYLSGAYITHL